MNKAARNIAQLVVCASAMTLLGCGGGAETNTVSNAVDPTKPVSDWQMVWSDEFDGASIDNNKWTHEINCDGGGNLEQQCYTDSAENSFIQDGMLNIVALPAVEGADKPYTSARLITQYKADFKYGRIEMRAKAPSGQGSWPAFWMMPTDSEYGGWPRSGEIDIFESVNLGVSDDEGNVETAIHGTLHYGKSWPNNSSSGKSYSLPDGLNPADDFHTYAVEWQEGEIRWYMDDYLYATQRQSEVRYKASGEAVGLAHTGWFTEYFDQTTGELVTHWDSAPFDKEFFLILNFAVGGDWPENVNNLGVDADAFATGDNAFEVDYVRVYECAINPETGKGCETVRGGYDSFDDALVEGKAPGIGGGVATNLTIFADRANPIWPVWDCCGGSTPTIEQDSENGAVAQFTIGEAPTVMGFNSRLSTAFGTEPFDASPLEETGFVSFDMKIIDSPIDTAASWYVKLESADAASAADFQLTESIEGVAPVSGQWQTFTFPLQDFSNKGLDLSQLDIVMVFPTWGQGEGAVYQIDNVKIAQPLAELVLFDDAANADWPAWDCCTGTTPAEVMDDAEHGLAIEFSITGETVMGFSAGDDVFFDASSIVSGGMVSFDMKLMTAPTDTSSVWKFKIEAGGTTSVVELDLIDGSAGVEPVIGEWQTYMFSIAALQDAGLDVSQIDVVMVFPAWGTGAGATYRIDNAKIYSPEAAKLTLLEDSLAEHWTIWDCCAGSTPNTVIDDEAHGVTAEFSVNGDTVMGFLANDDVYFDATSAVETGVVSFDMKVIASPDDATSVWKFKVESGDTSSEVELDLVEGSAEVEPVVGEWKTYSFTLKALQNAGLDVSQIDVIMIYPAWGSGTGAVYRVDNAYIGNP
ncbi:glycoside hydrolase family 16 protein [Paraglaciecola sp. L3A3]|uniref:glycoside hydrolase family 16 protein n=1 Tax=Paraglaciecola sp. L3A3 TaxID=2686358 RepID=UPI00131A8815|nr:glycoside hydrolase family 16 protein [Paraglaciecola sp. L3A3]